MGVIQRFKDIMSANINAMLDKAENPEKMIDQYMRNLEDDLGKVKAETASVMAEEARAKRAYDEALAEVEKYQKYAEKAVAAGNDNDARVFLQSKKTAQSKLEGLKLTYVNDISDLRARKETIKAKVAVAKAQERVNQVGSSLRGVSNNMSAFDRMEEKANKMLDTANAMAQLNESANTNVDDLARKYDLDDVAGTSDIDDELAALKAKLN